MSIGIMKNGAPFSQHPFRLWHFAGEIKLNYRIIITKVKCTWYANAGCMCVWDLGHSGDSSEFGNNLRAECVPFRGVLTSTPKSKSNFALVIGRERTKGDDGSAMIIIINM